MLFKDFSKSAGDVQYKCTVQSDIQMLEFYLKNYFKAPVSFKHKNMTQQVTVLVNENLQEVMMTERRE